MFLLTDWQEFLAANFNPSLCMSDQLTSKSKVHISDQTLRVLRCAESTDEAA